MSTLSIYPANGRSTRPAAMDQPPTENAPFEQWADATFATDPKGGGKTLRAPNGVIQDGQEYWSAGKAAYDPARIKAPVLLVVGEWDKDTPPYMAQTLFPLLVNASGSGSSC